MPNTTRCRPTGTFGWLATLSLVSFALSACQDSVAPAGSVASATQAVASSNSRAIPDEYIVVFENTVTDVSGRANALLKAHGGSLNSTYSTALRGFSAHLSAKAAEALADDPSVAFVEPDRVFVLAGTQTNPAWGLDRIDQPALPLDGIFTYPNSGAGVNVYIIDSGVRRTHVEFGGRVVPDYSAIADGYGPDGCQWHGTHVAGIIGGTVYGVAKGVTLHSVRAYDCNGVGTTSSILAAVDWVTTNRVRPAVASMSMSGPASLSINAAVDNSINAGVTYVVSAGNNAGADACGYSPAGVARALTVAAIGGLDAQASYSNVGGCVDLYAPGTQIYAAINSSDTAIQLNSGTSQASAFVAGAAALYLATNTGASPDQVAQAIISGATTGVVTGVTGGTANRLLRVSGGTASPPPPPPPSGNAPPVANFTSSCSKASCSFDGSSSTDDSGISTYAWNFGDGTSASGSSPLTSHLYTTKGNYTVTVTLTVTDNGGLSSSVQKSVTIRNKGR